MAKTSAQTLITDLAARLDLATADATVRADMLRQLNISQGAVLQDHSWRFLNAEGALSLPSAASSVAVPTTIDDGKDMTLGRPTGDGEIQYVPPDRWYQTRLDTYGEPTQTAPSYWTIALVSGVNSFLFKPGNTSGGSLSIPYQAQLIPVDLTDANNSFSPLPETFEDTLLIDHAEVELKRFHNQAVPPELITRAKDKQERLYASYRTTKEQARTTREQQERKVADETLATGKP